MKWKLLAGGAILLALAVWLGRLFRDGGESAPAPAVGSSTPSRGPASPPPPAVAPTILPLPPSKTVAPVTAPTPPAWQHELEAALRQELALELKDAPVDLALDALRKLTEVNLVVDPAAAERLATPVSLSREQRNLGLALDAVLRQAGLRREFTCRVVYVTADAPAGAADGRPLTLAEQLNRPVTLGLDRLPFRDLAALLQRMTGAPIVVDPACPDEPISLHFQDRPLRSILETLAQLTETQLEFRKEAVYFRAVGATAPVETDAPDGGGVF